MNSRLYFILIGICLGVNVYSQFLFEKIPIEHLDSKRGAMESSMQVDNGIWVDVYPYEILFFEYGTKKFKSHYKRDSLNWMQTLDSNNKGGLIIGEVTNKRDSIVHFLELDTLSGATEVLAAIDLGKSIRSIFGKSKKVGNNLHFLGYVKYVGSAGDCLIHIIIDELKNVHIAKTECVLEHLYNNGIHFDYDIIHEKLLLTDSRSTRLYDFNLNLIKEYFTTDFANEHNLSIRNGFIRFKSDSMMNVIYNLTFVDGITFTTLKIEEDNFEYQFIGPAVESEWGSFFPNYYRSIENEYYSLSIFLASVIPVFERTVVTKIENNNIEELFVYMKPDFFINQFYEISDTFYLVGTDFINGLGFSPHIIIATPQTSSAESIKDSNNINVYPNPASDQIIIKSDDVIDRVTLLSYTGTILAIFDDVNMMQKKITFDSESYNGLYFLYIDFKDGNQICEKLVISN